MIEVPAEPADPQFLPPTLKYLPWCPRFLADIDLSMDDGFLHVSCWGTGDMLQYDVSDPFAPKPSGKDRVGGIVSGQTYPDAARGNSTAATDGRDQSRWTARLVTYSLCGVTADQVG